MARARTLILDTRVNVSGEEKLTRLSKQFETTGARVKSALSPGNLFAAAGIGVGIAQITSFLSDATNAAAEFQDSVSATGVIFGEQAIPQLEEWADKAHSAFGASKQDALAAANQFAVFGKSAGLLGDELVSFSTEMVQLGGDLASMFGGTTQDAISAVGAALRGENEAIRRYGVLLDDATLRQQAFEMGLVSTTKNALTPQQRVLAAHAAILEQTGDAQGDFARTADGMANTQRTLAAQLENVTIEIGEKLLPVMLDLVNFINDKGVPAMREFIDLLDFSNENSAQGIPILGEIEDFLNAIPKFGLRLNDQLTGMKFKIEDAAEAMGVSYDTLRERIHRVMEQTGKQQEEVLEGMIGVHKKVAGQIGTILPQAIKQATSAVDAAAADMADGLPGAMEEAKQEAEKIARSTPGALADQLRAGIDDYGKALDELTEVAANSVSDLAERQEIEGILASQRLTDALNSDSTRTRLLAQDLVADLVSDYELLAPGALRAGQLVNPSLSSGLRSNLGLTHSAAAAIVDAAGNPLVNLGNEGYGWGQTLSANFHAGMLSYIGAIRDASIRLGDAAASGIRLRSPAKEGPLSGDIAGWGRRLGQMFAAGMQQSVSLISAASLAMGGSAVPGLGLSGTSPAGGGSGGITNIFNLHWDGEPPRGRNESEIANNLGRLLPVARGY